MLAPPPPHSLQVHVPMPEMQNLRVAIELAIVDPSHLERTLPEFVALLQPLEVREAQAKVPLITSGLRSFELHPTAKDGTKLLTGLSLFDHLIMMARRSVRTGVDLTPNASLDLEYTSQQQRIINPRPIDYAMHEIAKHAHGKDAQQAMAKRKLDNLGYFRSDCGLANDPERIKRLANQLGLTKSLAIIANERTNEKAATDSLATARLIEMAPAALEKLQQKGNDPTKITMGEMAAIAFKHFKGMALKGNKAAHVKELADLIKQQPGVLQLTATTTTTARPTALGPTPPPATIAATAVITTTAAVAAVAVAVPLPPPAAPAAHAVQTVPAATTLEPASPAAPAGPALSTAPPRPAPPVEAEA